MTPTTTAPLGTRERNILNLLVQMHAEYGLDKTFTAQAVEKIAGSPCPGSLAALVMKGYAIQQSVDVGITYAVTEAGYAMFAGIEGQV